MKKGYALISLFFILVAITSCKKNNNPPKPPPPTNPTTTSVAVSIGQSPPIITYTYPQFYTVGKAITDLKPKNTGTAIPALVYAHVKVFAGSHIQGGHTNGVGISATFQNLVGIVKDQAGNLYVTENTDIRKIAPDATVSTFVTFPNVVNHGSATVAMPSGITIDQSGNLYVCLNAEVKKITPAGVVTTFATGFSGNTGITIDPSGNFYVADLGDNTVKKVTSAGVVSTFATNVPRPFGITIDPSGNLFVCNPYDNIISKITPAGVVSVFAGGSISGTADGTGTAASFFYPTGIVSDLSGNLYVTDSFNNRIRKITTTAVVTTFAGSGKTWKDEGVGLDANFSTPGGITIDQTGTLYTTETANVIRTTTATGYTISPALPAGLSFDVTTGIISGTPTAASAAAVYTITGYSPTGGTSITTITLTVKS